MRLQVENVSYSYPGKKHEVISNVSLTVDSGERVALRAPSGYGKTTLCQLIAGYRQPKSGRILIDGEPLPKKGYCPVQMIWQHPEKAVNPRLKMKEVIAEGDHIPQYIIDGLGIEHEWYERYPQELSGGELQRFCIARALGERTKFLIADEISTMLDLITQSQIWNFLLEVTEKTNMGLIMVSHSDELIEYVGARVIDLADPVPGK